MISSYIEKSFFFTLKRLDQKPRTFIWTPQRRIHLPCSADCNLHILSDIHHSSTAGSWDAVGSLPQTALSSECGGIFGDLWGCLWAAWKGHFADLWMTGVNDLWKTRQGKRVIDVDCRECFFGGAYVCVRACVFKRGVSIPHNLTISGTFCCAVWRGQEGGRVWVGGYKWISKKVTSSHFHKSSLTFICCKRCLCN